MQMPKLIRTNAYKYVQIRGLLFISFFLFKSSFILLSEDLLASESDPAVGITVSTRYHNKKVYYPDTPIMLRVYIKNDSPKDCVLQLADDPILNLNVRVKTLTNINLRPSESYFARLFGSQPFVYRLMNLRPGEGYSFDLDVRQFIQIEEPGVYIIETDFIPNKLSSSARFRRNKDPKSTPILSLLPPSESTSWINNQEEEFPSTLITNPSHPPDSNYPLPTVVSANTLGLTIRPAVGTREIKRTLAEDTGEILSRIALSPDEVVEYMLNARQKNLWNKFFLYINLESLFLNNIDRSRRYRVSDTGTKKHMIENFRTQLVNQELELGISVKPYLFKILSVYYTDTNARVLTRQVFQTPQYQEIKEYSWFLRKENGFWAIYDYEVKSLGTE